jgi:hypothetical protein
MGSCQLPDGQTIPSTSRGLVEVNSLVENSLKMNFRAKFQKKTTHTSKRSTAFIQPTKPLRIIASS